MDTHRKDNRDFRNPLLARHRRWETEQKLGMKLEKWLIKGYFEEKKSSLELRQELEVMGFCYSSRSIQRILASAVKDERQPLKIRTVKESFNLAISKGRMTYDHMKNPDKAKRHGITVKVRFQVLERDGRRCVICGNGREQGAILHVDHIDPKTKSHKVKAEQLQTLCSDCNQGKSLLYENWRK